MVVTMRIELPEGMRGSRPQGLISKGGFSDQIQDTTFEFGFQVNEIFFFFFGQLKYVQNIPSRIFQNS